jgi:glycosyltransferase involved in cell wall biosynthesis
MRILHYMQAIDFRKGGPPRAVVDQVATMQARGHDAVVATTVIRDVPEAWLDAGASPRAVALPPVGGPLGRLSRSALQMLESEVRSADVVHLHGVWEVSSLQVAAIARRLGRPYVISLRGMLDDWSMDQRGLKKRIYLRLGGRRYLESACRVHCTADAELEQSRKWFPRGTGVVVPNLIDLAPFESIPDPELARSTWPRLASSPFRFLFLSRVQYKKGIEHLIDAVGLLRDRGHELLVVIAGSGDEEYLQAMRSRARSRNVDDTFFWTGHVGGDLKWSLYSACDVFVLPTSQENFGFVFFESLAAGTPVVTTDLVDTRDEIARSGGGVIVSQTATAFADALESFMNGQRDAENMGKHGRSWTLENLDTSAVAERFERLYAECVEVSDSNRSSS